MINDFFWILFFKKLNQIKSIVWASFLFVSIDRVTLQGFRGIVASPAWGTRWSLWNQALPCYLCEKSGKSNAFPSPISSFVTVPTPQGWRQFRRASVCKALGSVSSTHSVCRREAVVRSKFHEGEGCVLLAMLVKYFLDENYKILRVLCSIFKFNFFVLAKHLILYYKNRNYKEKNGSGNSPCHLCPSSAQFLLP